MVSTPFSPSELMNPFAVVQQIEAFRRSYYQSVDHGLPVQEQYRRVLLWRDAARQAAQHIRRTGWIADKLRQELQEAEKFARLQPH